MKLLIAQSINDFSLFKKNITKNTDILIFDQNLMVLLDNKGLKYKVIEDFYSSDQFKHDVIIYQKEVKNFLTQLDRACQDEANFQFAYSGNELYFLNWFDHIFYLEKLIKTLKKKYKKIFIFSSNKPKKFSRDQFHYSKLNSRYVNGSISLSHEYSAKKCMQLIYNTGNVVFLNDKHAAKEDIPIKYKIIFFYNKLKNYYYRKIFIKYLKTIKSFTFKKRRAYAIQETYEISRIKNYLPNLSFQDPTTELRKKSFHEKPISTSKNLIYDTIKIFNKKYFYFLNKYVSEIINAYHTEIVGRVSYFKKEFVSLIKKDKPAFMLLGIGTRDVFDTVFCNVANVYNIPVILFQHAGSVNLLVDTPNHQESLEFNNRTFKTLVVQAKKEKINLKNKKTQTLHIGSIEQYEFNHFLKNKPIKEVLFCIGPDADYDFRYLLINAFSGFKKYKQSLDIFEVVDKLSLSIDIKFNSLKEKENFRRYKKIIKNNKYKNINIIYGGTSETISRKFKLIIIDYMASAILKDIFCLSIPIIIYMTDFDKLLIDKEVMTDIYKRCYIARNKFELIKLLERFKSKKLYSKFNKEIIDKFIYPIDKGNPGKNFAKYIDNIL